MGRVWRDGQKKRVYIYRLLSTGSIEEKIYQRQVTKQSLSTQLVDEKTAINSLFAKDDLRTLFKLKSDTESETHDLLFCDCCSKEVKSRRQMFQTKKKSKMEELKSWDHYNDVNDLDDDILSKSAPDLISFVFTNFVKGEAKVKE